MKREVAGKILDLQERIRKDCDYQALVREYEDRSRRLSEKMESMTREQQDAVTDYCGVLIELQWKVLEHAISRG